MEISANSIRAGNILLYKDELWSVAKTPVHTKPGKGPAYVQVEMKNIKTGNKLNERFSSSDHVTRVQLERKDYQFLYIEDNNLILMDMDNFEQISINSKIMDDKILFLEDNMMLFVEFYEDMPISIDLPQTIICTIINTDPVIKGSTVTSSYKPAILHNKVKVMVPSYLTIGEKILVKTEDVSFVERVKS
jgi:elongation factor P